MQNCSVSSSPYIGRFAPSPSGPLHLGSLVCALASYLDAKVNGGVWHVRIEDIDPPREQAGATASILETLQKHGMLWDGPIRYQSQQSETYLERLESLNAQGLSYRCICTRKRLNALGGRYDRFCLSHPASQDAPAAVRLSMQACAEQFHAVSQQVRFTDEIQGSEAEDIGGDDFVIHRKDGLFAYQLAVVVDDIDQGITHIVRGTDLIDTTSRQIYLTKLLGGRTPIYAHIPVVVDVNGNKLSKQNHAPAVNNQTARKNVLQACGLMGFDTSGWQDLTIPDMLLRATESWVWVKKRLAGLNTISATGEV